MNDKHSTMLALFLNCLILAVLVTALIFAFTGCVTSNFRNDYTKTDGSVSTTRYTTLSTAWPFGKLDTSAAKMKTSFGSATMEAGQDAAGMDNTAQTAVLDAVIRAAIKAAATAPLVVP